uniref:Uncharacterized protein n=1 Tax=Anguilla anguilla TaxID=7936 RepID=A0A0E9U3L8_ANGAN
MVDFESDFTQSSVLKQCNGGL